MLTLRMKVYGKVQGVGFRFYTRQQANKLGIKGWVRNSRDGTVEILAQGDQTAMQTFTAAVKKGSPTSKVEHVEVKEVHGVKGYKAFRVKY